MINILTIRTDCALIAIRTELSKRTDLVPDTTIPQYADEDKEKL